jgi:hypothetical protein
MLLVFDFVTKCFHGKVVQTLPQCLDKARQFLFFHMPEQKSETKINKELYHTILGVDLRFLSF